MAAGPNWCEPALPHTKLCGHQACCADVFHTRTLACRCHHPPPSCGVCTDPGAGKSGAADGTGIMLIVPVHAKIMTRMVAIAFQPCNAAAHLFIAGMCDEVKSLFCRQRQQRGARHLQQGHSSTGSASCVSAVLSWRGSSAEAQPRPPTCLHQLPPPLLHVYGGAAVAAASVVLAPPLLPCWHGPRLQVLLPLSLFLHTHLVSYSAERVRRL